MSEIEKMAGGWKPHSYQHGAIEHHYIVTSKGETVARFERKEDLDTVMGMLDHIATLEAQNAALQAQVGEWRGVDNPPLLVQGRWGGGRSSDAVLIILTVKGWYQEVPTSIEGVTWKGWDYKSEEADIIGWRPIPANPALSRGRNT